METACQVEHFTTFRFQFLPKTDSLSPDFCCFHFTFYLLWQDLSGQNVTFSQLKRRISLFLVSLLAHLFFRRQPGLHFQ